MCLVFGALIFPFFFEFYDSLFQELAKVVDADKQRYAEQKIQYEASKPVKKLTPYMIFVKVRDMSRVRVLCALNFDFFIRL